MKRLSWGRQNPAIYDPNRVTQDYGPRHILAATRSEPLPSPRDTVLELMPLATATPGARPRRSLSSRAVGWGGGFTLRTDSGPSWEGWWSQSLNRTWENRFFVKSQQREHFQGGRVHGRKLQMESI